MIDNIYSLIPPLLVLLFVLTTKKVILSIGVGIISAALLINNFALIKSIKHILTVFINTFYVDGAFNSNNILLLSFLLLLGILTSLIADMGGSLSFALWAKKYINNGKKAQLLTMILGIIIFIDDYFNALTVGEIARPLNDEYQISRTKLAYIIDSTSAPVCVLAPLSSWGAYIISIFANLPYIISFTGAPIVAFIKTIPYNYYAIFSLLMVFASIYGGVTLGKMEHANNDTFKDKTNTSTSGSPYDLLLPIITLIISATLAIFISGLINGGLLDLLVIMENANTYLSLFIGVCLAIGVAIFRYHNKTIAKLKSAFINGIKAMSGAVIILISAWVLIDFISIIGSGIYLSSVFVIANFNPTFLPALLFIIAAVMALATGTSWGTFGVMIPIAAQMAITLDSSLLLICFGAVLSGSVFGDHCSPISDTTILSSTGAKCHHIAHVVTQLPYALVVSIISLIGFITAGYTKNVVISFVVPLLFFILAVSLLSKNKKSLSKKA